MPKNKSAKQLPFTPEVRARWRKVKAAILAEPKAYNQNSAYTPIGRPDCGTPVCLGGWFHFFRPEAERDFKCWIESARSVGILEHVGLWTMGGADWPEPFKSRFYGARTNQEKALAASKRIDYLLRTGV